MINKKYNKLIFKLFAAKPKKQTKSEFQLITIKNGILFR